MTDAELQSEEREVLSSIYDGDEAFKQISSTVYQYKVRIPLIEQFLLCFSVVLNYVSFLSSVW